MMDAETLVVLGADLPCQQFYPQDARVVQVDLRGEQIGRRTPVDVGLGGTVKDTITALLPLLTEHTRSKHLDAATRHFAKTRRQLEDLTTPSRRTVHPQYPARLIDDDAVSSPMSGPR